MNKPARVPLTALVACLLTASPLFAQEEVVKKPLRLTQGGTAEKPAVFDGRGMVIDLGIDVTDHEWKMDGDLWASRGPLSGPKPFAPGQFTALYLDETPITIARVAPAPNGERHSLKPGQMGCTDDGSIYFRWPEGKTPGKTRIIIPAKASMSCVTIACSHIVVKNITAKYANNDGFNIHGAWIGIRLENIKAFCNADEGISAHDDVQMDVDGAEIAWNGSSVGGVADVNRSVTTYKNCRVHDNIGGAFKFSGKSHVVTDTVIYNQARDFFVAPETKFKQGRVEFRPRSKTTPESR